MSSLNISEAVATTLRRREKELADNITKNHPFMYRLEEKGNIKSVQGGRVLTHPLMYAENSTVKWYSGYETFTVGAPDETIDAAEYDWKQLGGFAAISGIEEIKNQGMHAAVDLIEARIEVLQKTLRNATGASVFSDGTGTSGKEFGGLQLLVADDPTAAGTVGGINQQTQSFWRNQVNDLSGGSVTTTSSNITGYMNRMNLATLRGTDKVDLIMCDDEMYTFYEESLQQYQRFNTSKLADAGFEALKYKTADVVYDEECPAYHMYFLNTDYLNMKCAAKRKFKVGKSREIQNADYRVVPVWLAGNLTCSNRSLQGLVIGRPAP